MYTHLIGNQDYFENRGVCLKSVSFNFNWENASGKQHNIWKINSINTHFLVSSPSAFLWIS